jgi:hypothetical protein
LDEDVQVADSPQWLLDLAKPSVRPLSSANAKVETNIGPGRRTPLLFKIAGKLRAEGVPRDGIIGALTGLNSTFDPPHPAEKILNAADGIERYPGAKASVTAAPDLLCLADVEALPVPWLWEGYLAFGMVAMLSGDPGSGKHSWRSLLPPPFPMGGYRCQERRAPLSPPSIYRERMQRSTS